MKTKTSFGHDIAITRADDLDKLMMLEVESNPDIRVLDIGCGAAGQANRLAELGATVTAVDINDYASEVRNLNPAINFIHGSMSDVLPSLLGEQYDFAYLQRVIHYLDYHEAVVQLTKLQSVTSRLYISFSGLDTEIGQHHLAPDRELPNRFDYLDKDGQQKFNISERICLYTKSEVGALLHEAGWNIDKIWVSAFGNIKVICTKNNS